MDAKPRHYDTAFKEMAVLLSYERTNLLELAVELDKTPKILCNWRRIYREFGKGSFPGSGYLRLSPQQRIIHDLEKKINESNSKFDILKNGNTYLCARNLWYFTL